MSIHCANITKISTNATRKLLFLTIKYWGGGGNQGGRGYGGGNCPQPNPNLACGSKTAAQIPAAGRPTKNTITHSNIRKVVIPDTIWIKK